MEFSLRDSFGFKQSLTNFIIFSVVINLLNLVFWFALISKMQSSFSNISSIFNCLLYSLSIILFIGVSLKVFSYRKI